MPRALIVVDVQRDFCPGGSLAVQGGDQVAARITQWVTEDRADYAAVVATMDWHPAPGGPRPFDHFSEAPDYVNTWPPHCVQGTPGAALHPSLALPGSTIVVRKGQDAAAYSGFQGHDDEGNPLAAILERRGIDAVDVVGLATDHCVRATALDARALGLSVRILTEMIAGVDPDASARALQELRSTGVTIE